MTISDIKRLNEQNGGKFFSRENMRFFGDTLKNYGVGRGYLPNTVLVYRKRAMKPHVPLTRWLFSTLTGRVVQQQKDLPERD